MTMYEAPKSHDKIANRENKYLLEKKDCFETRRLGNRRDSLN